MLLDLEFSIFQKSYPQMEYHKCMPIFFSGKVSHPRKQEYLAAIDQISRTLAHKGSSAYFGLYFSGSTIRMSGDWAVLNDQGETDAISLDDVYSVLHHNKYRGQLWMSLDGPGSGHWIYEMSKKYRKTYTTLSNILIDSNTDRFGQADWLVYVIRLKDPTTPLWCANRPISYNYSFPAVVWPSGSSTNIPTQSVFQWLSNRENRKIVHEATDPED